MLDATDAETEQVRAYMASTVSDDDVTFLQKLRVENVHGIRHEAWDVHCESGDRWWVITNPTNLYSQEQFPNLDVAITFHVGLALRIPRTERPTAFDLLAEPFAKIVRLMGELSDALAQAQEVGDFQAVGVRCRECLLAFASASQVILPWRASDGARPKDADFKAWAEHICNTTLPGGQHEDRRKLFKSQLRSVWDFSNWLTHAKRSTLHDAEAATLSVEHILGLVVALVIRHIRKVPEACPACGSARLSPERGIRTDEPDVEWERPVCTKCGWCGEPVKIEAVPTRAETRDGEPVPVSPPEGECVIQTVPVRSLTRKPRRKSAKP